MQEQARHALKENVRQWPPDAHKSELHFRRLLEKLPAGAYTCDADGLITYFNPQAVTLWGRAPKLNDPVDRFCGSFKLFAAADGAAITHDCCWMALALQTGDEYNGKEIVIERPDGSRVTALAHANPIRDESGKLLGAVNVLVDITARRRVEEEVRRANQMLRALVQSSPVPIVVIDIDPPVVQLWNPAAERLFGWSEADVLGRVMPITPPDKQAECHGHRTAVARGEVLSCTETTRQRNDGSTVEVSLSAAPLHAADGTAYGILLLFNDVTDRKRADDASKEADRSKNEFLATLAQELRHPLAPVRNAAQILRHQTGRSPESQWALDVVDRQVNKMTRLIDDLLDVAQITRNSTELHKERVDLGQIMHMAVETSRPLIEACGHECALSMPVQRIALNGDRTRLAQVISNLLSNAAKYTERGGRIELTAEQQGNEAVIVVRDTGIGIPAEMLPRIFKLFTRVDQSLDRSEGGLGIGLALVKQLVEIHGGAISAYSEGQGKGSRFTIRLPIAADVLAAPVP